jgi:2-polyprenyl-3-methyl-5-hydroxy-6-metoxy-1,4-benzoquinol methylase
MGKFLMKVSQRVPGLQTRGSSKGDWHARAIFASKPRTTAYGGLNESAAAGLHEFAFRMFRKYVPPHSDVLDLGSGEGAWAKRLMDASYEITACDAEPRAGRGLHCAYHKVDLNANFSENFPMREYDAISFMEVIEHLENPRHSFRQIAALLKDGGMVLISTPNASGLYSRLRFFFTGQMAMFTDGSYSGNGHITPLTAWQLEKIFMENGFSVLERRFHDAPFVPPRSLVLRPLDCVTKLMSGLLARKLPLDGNLIAIHPTIPGPSLLAQASDVSDSAFA